jgi:hypothetical protein
MMVIYVRNLMNQLSKKEEKEREERREIAQRFSRRYNNARLVGYMKQPTVALQPGIERRIIPEKTRSSNSGHAP